MIFEIPPVNEKYKLVGTFKHDGDIYLAMLKPGKAFNVKWADVEVLEDEELREYLLSLSYGIERGVYDVELLENG